MALEQPISRLASLRSLVGAGPQPVWQVFIVDHVLFCLQIVGFILAAARASHACEDGGTCGIRHVAETIGMATDNVGEGLRVGLSLPGAFLTVGIVGACIAKVYQ